MTTARTGVLGKLAPLDFASRERLTRWTALAVIYLVWGSTYLAIRVMDDAIPPLIGASARFLITGIVLTAWVLARHGPAAFDWQRSQWFVVGVTALLLVVGGPGMTTVAEHFVPSGLAALLVASQPLWVVAWRVALREPVGAFPVVGVILGLAGVALLVLSASRQGAHASVLGITLILCVALSYATGSFWYQRWPLPSDAVAVTAAQMLLSGAVLLPVALITGEFARFRLSAVSAASVWGLAYLIGAGSLLAYTTYLWLLRHAPVTQVTTYAYVNPVIAVMLGAVILSEQITPQIMAGAALTITAVILIVRAEPGPADPNNDPA